MLSRSGTVAVIAIFSIIVIGRLLSPSPAERLVARLRSEHLLTDRWNGDIAAIMPLFTAGTRFEGHVRINDRPEEDCVNLYVTARGALVDAKLPELRQLRNNCAFVGRPNVVICDGDFIEGFGPRTENERRKAVGRDPLTRFEESEAYGSDYQRSLLTWVLGHEVGHIVKRHRPSHFSESAFESPSTRLGDSQDLETQADLFVAQQLVADSSRKEEVGYLIFGLLQSEVARKQGYEDVGVGLTHTLDPIVVNVTSTHPDFIVRCVRLYEQAFPDNPLQFQFDGLKEIMTTSSEGAK